VFAVVEKDDAGTNEIYFSVLHDNDAIRVANSLSKNTNLRSVCFCAEQFNVRAAKRMANAIRNSHLEKIFLSIFDTRPSLAAAMRILFLEGLMKSRTIRQLVIGGRIGDIDALLKSTGHMVGFSVQMPTLTATVPNYAMQRMCQSLVSKLSNMKHLRFGYMKLGVERMAMISRGLRGHRSLKTLSLSHCYLQDTEVDVLVRDWEDDYHVEVLNVKMNAITANGVISLVQTSARCRSLHTLSVTGSALVNGNGLRSIALELGGNLGLRWKTVDLRFCIMEAEWKPLSSPVELGMRFERAMQLNQNIFELKLNGNGIGIGIGGNGGGFQEIALAGARNIRNKYTLSGTTLSNVGE
jgi:hypothetical protein